MRSYSGVYAWQPAFLRSIASSRTQNFRLRSFRPKKIQVRSTTRICGLSASGSTANPRTRGKPVATVEEIEDALGDLSAEADSVVRSTASMVFLSTALMQNGRLDGLVVLFTQIQMVGRIARIYVQRPSPRELARLYANVAGTAFVASRLESLDLGEMVAPLAVSIVPALKSGIPGMGGISALLVRCVSNGAANAFLTLRVGEVARRYCELTSRCPAEFIRKSATAAAVQHLGRIVRENGALVVRKVWESTAGGLIESGVSKAEDIAGATRDLFGRISPWRVKEEPPAVSDLCGCVGRWVPTFDKQLRLRSRSLLRAS